MIHSTQMLALFGTMCLIFLTGIASSTDENLFQEPQCLQPIEYNMNISAEVQNNLLIVNSRVKLNILCTQYKIRIYVGQYCNVTYDFDIDNKLPMYTSWVYEPFSTKDGSIDLNIIRHSIENNTIKRQIMKIESGLYWISMNYNCTLGKVATIVPYITETKEEKYLILSRIPAEWIVPYWKNPATKAAFTIRIKHDYFEKVLSHMPVNKRVEINQVYTALHTTLKISTHLIATAVVSLECSTYVSLLIGSSMQSRVQVKNDISYAVSVIDKIMSILRDKLGVIPASYVHYAALPININNYVTIVTTGLVLFGDANIAYNKEIDSIIKKREVIFLVAPNVIQEMFSEWLLTFKQSDPWFIEGFLTVYGVYAIEQNSTDNKTLLKSIMIQTRREVFEYTQACIEYDFPLQENLFLRNVPLVSKMWKAKGYRVNYDYKSLENIAFFLTHLIPNVNWIFLRDHLIDVTLAQILDDAFYFLIENTQYIKHFPAKSSNIDIFFNLASKVIYVENSYITWYPIFTAFQYVSKIFPFSKSAIIKNKILELTNRFLDDTSYKTHSSENSVTNQVYHEVLKWTCIVGGLKCKKHVRAILKWHVQNPVQNKLLPSWQKWIYCQGMKRKSIRGKVKKIQYSYASREIFLKMFQLFPCCKLTDGLEALRSSLELRLIKESDSVTILFDIVARHVRDISSLNFLIRTIQVTFPRKVNLLAVVTFIINHIYLDEVLQKITKNVVLRFTKLMDIYDIEKNNLICDIILEKIENRRFCLILNDMRMDFPDVPPYLPK